METKQKQVAASGLIIGLVCGVVLAGIIGGGWYISTRFSSTNSPPQRPQLRPVPPVNQSVMITAGQSSLTPADAVDAWKQYHPPTSPLSTPPSIPSPYGALPTARSCPAAARLGDIVFITAGFTRKPNYFLNGSEVLELANNNWFSAAPCPLPVEAPASAEVGGRFFLCGGFDGARSRQEAYWYDATTDRWQTCAKMPYARCGATAVGGSDGKVYVFGSDPQLKDPYDMQVYDPGHDSWQAFITPVKLACYGTAREYNGKIFVFGGFTPTNMSSNQLAVYDPSANSWAIAAPMPRALCWSSPTIWRDRIWLFGGMAAPGAISGQVDVYDPNTDAWSRGRDIAIPRTRMAAVTLDDGILLLGGCDLSGNVFDAAELYIP